jgi:hypothetical protein
MIQPNHNGRVSFRLKNSHPFFPLLVSHCQDFSHPRREALAKFALLGTFLRAVQQALYFATNEQGFTTLLTTGKSMYTSTKRMQRESARIDYSLSIKYCVTPTCVAIFEGYDCIISLSRPRRFRPRGCACLGALHPIRMMHACHGLQHTTSHHIEDLLINLA